MHTSHEVTASVEPLDGEQVAVDLRLPCGACGGAALRLARAAAPSPDIAGHGDCNNGLRRPQPGQPGRRWRCTDSLNSVAGAMLEPLGVTIHAVDLGHVTQEHRRVAGWAFGC